jgi:hypothetical protein
MIIFRTLPISILPVVCKKPGLEFIGFGIACLLSLVPVLMRFNRQKIAYFKSFFLIIKNHEKIAFIKYSIYQNLPFSLYWLVPVTLGQALPFLLPSYLYGEKIKSITGTLLYLPIKLATYTESQKNIIWRDYKINKKHTSLLLQCLCCCVCAVPFVLVPSFNKFIPFFIAAVVSSCTYRMLTNAINPALVSNPLMKAPESIQAFYFISIIAALNARVNFDISYILLIAELVRLTSLCMVLHANKNSSVITRQ